MRDKPDSDKDYVPDNRLNQMYSEANDLDEHGLDGLCPAYSELVGTTIRYRDQTLIGEGALKEVYRTYDEQIHRWIAMARLRQDRGPDFYDLFVREAWLIASLSHPNIIKIYDMGADAEGRPYFSMDLKSNTTLSDLVGEADRSELHNLLQIFGKVCDAMAYAHSRGVVHLDLKPENIQVDAYGDVLVCDWGLGKVVEEAVFEEDGAAYPDHIWGNMTLMGQIKGSPGYMAPEQVTAGTLKDHRTDIYALGCMLHFILTGQSPFTGSRENVLADTAASKVVSPRLHYPDRYVPESLDAVVMKATALNPAERYPSVTRLQQEIESYLTGFSTHAEESGFFREAKLFIARNRVPAAITAIALLVLGVMGALFTQHLGRQKRATEVERGRAEQLSEEVETLDLQYASYMEDTLAAKKALASQLSISANNLKNLAIYEHPLRTVEQSRNMVEVALQQDPDCVAAHDQLFALNSLMLNYKAALEYPDSIRPFRHYQQSVLFAEAFPDYDFSKEKRPTEEQLVGFFYQARLIDSTKAAHLERVLTYDWAARANLTEYTQVVEAFLQYMYGGPEHLSLSLNAENATLSLWSDRHIRLAGQQGYQNGLLRFLSFRFLELDVAGAFKLADLGGLSIESLDLSRCKNVKLKQSVSLPQLRKLCVRAGQFSPEQLRKQIQTNASFEIVEVASAEIH